jgi:Integrase core domain
MDRRNRSQAQRRAQRHQDNIDYSLPRPVFFQSLPPRSHSKVSDPLERAWRGPRLKGECIRPRTPLSLDDARRLVEGYVEHYNNVRLNSAIGYIAPKDLVAWRQQEIHAERDRKLQASRKQRQIRRQQAA